MTHIGLRSEDLKQCQQPSAIAKVIEEVSDWGMAALTQLTVDPLGKGFLLDVLALIYREGGPLK